MKNRSGGPFLETVNEKSHLEVSTHNALVTTLNAETS